MAASSCLLPMVPPTRDIVSLCECVSEWVVNGMYSCVFRLLLRYWSLYSHMYNSDEESYYRWLLPPPPSGDHTYTQKLRKQREIETRISNAITITKIKVLPTNSLYGWWMTATGTARYHRFTLFTAIYSFRINYSISRAHTWYTTIYCVYADNIGQMKISV